jgi:hypothetical protein
MRNQRHQRNQRNQQMPKAAPSEDQEAAYTYSFKFYYPNSSTKLILEQMKIIRNDNSLMMLPLPLSFIRSNTNET